MAGAGADPQERQPLKLLDPSVDVRHQSCKSAVYGVQLSVFRTRTASELLTLDDRWIERLRWSGLLPLCRMIRMIEAGAREHRKPKRRGNYRCFCYDKSLLAALVDRWRPETHTFHLPVGEMAPTLQDVAYLLGLPCAGTAVVAVDASPSWHADIRARFARVVPLGGRPRDFSMAETYGPPKWWLLQYTAENIHPDADDDAVSRHLEAYLLWLFGWVLFTNGEGHAVDKSLVFYARAIADSTVDNVPQYSWGSAVLAATYRALCDACFKSRDVEPVLTGCPLLLQLWSYERFHIGRPLMDHNFYVASLYHEAPEDRPTMGFLWFCRKGTWAHVQPHRNYPNFTRQFDELLCSDVVWTPYTSDLIETRAPLGLSSLCERDSELWLTTRPVVFDIFVEEYSPQRVMRQFGLRQDFPPLLARAVSATDHLHTRRGHTSGHLWGPVMAPWAGLWERALEERVEEDRPYEEESYPAYMRWYSVATRTQVGHTHAEDVVHVASVTDTYPPYRAQASYGAHNLMWECQADADSAIHRLQSGIQMTMEELLSTFHRISTKLGSAVWLSSCRTSEDVGEPRARQLPQTPLAPPLAPGARALRTMPRNQLLFKGVGPSSQGPPLQTSWQSHFNGASMSSQWPPRQGYWPPHVDQVGPSFKGPALQAMWRSQSASSTAQAQRDWDSMDAALPTDDGNEVEQYFANPDELPQSQLSGTPPPQTQASKGHDVTPPPNARAHRNVCATDRITFLGTQLGRGRRRGLEVDGAVRGIRPKRGRE